MTGRANSYKERKIMMFNGQVNGNNGHTAAADAGGGRKNQAAMQCIADDELEYSMAVPCNFTY